MKLSEIEQLLPEIFRITLERDGDRLLAGLLDVIADLLAPSEAVLDALETYFDPYQAPPPFVYYLAGWVDLDQFWLRNPENFTDAAQLPGYPVGVTQLRELVARATYLSKWRGTHKGLIAFLETATGVTGFHVEEEVADDAGELIPFHIVVHLPEAAAPYRKLIDRIVQIEKPAYVTAAVEQE